jgi:hypothetical protein
VADWGANGFDAQSGRSAADYLGLQEVNQYDPAVGAGRRRQVDCVVSFGLLEHVYISDVPPVLRDMFSCAARLMVLNVACYPDTETFPDGENSRITVRQPGWWKGMLDGISVDFPETSVCLICSTGWRQGNAFPIWKSATWQEDSSFVVGI